VLGDLVAGGYTYDLNGWFSPAYFQQQYEQSWLDMATMEGQMAGVWYKTNVKSLVWYPVPEFQNAGYQIPQTWTELLALSDQMAMDGRTPWCIGIESGPASGWVGTDWVEDIMLRTTTAQNYDLWVNGDLNFTSAQVRYAWQVMGSLWFNPNYVQGGTAAINSTFFGDAPLPMFDNPPGCWLHRQASFITDFFPEGVEYGQDYNYFPLPPIDAEQGKAVLIAGDLFGVFQDREEIRTFVQYLTTGESAKWWVQQGREVSPHKDADLSWYQALNRGAAQMVMDADVVRFDASDLMPAEVGAGSFWTGIVDYVNGVALDTVLANIDASWP
jgi:alpha-glucoside transport system substrate-binding protein